MKKMIMNQQLKKVIGRAVEFFEADLNPGWALTMLAYAHRQGDLLSVQPLRIDAEVAHRFNAYAQAAYPYEIGGLLRIVHDSLGWRAIDLMVLPQRVSGCTFALEEQALALINLNLSKDGRDDEIPEWRGIVHSHPSTAPFLSGVDINTLRNFTLDGFAFSVICRAETDTEHNVWSAHYAQANPLPVLLQDFPLVPTQPNLTLAGVSSLTEEQLQVIAEETAQLIDQKIVKNPRRFTHWLPRTDDLSSRGRQSNLDNLSDSALATCLLAVAQRREREKDTWLIAELGSLCGRLRNGKGLTAHHLELLNKTLENVLSGSNDDILEHELDNLLPVGSEAETVHNIHGQDDKWLFTVVDQQPEQAVKTQEVLATKEGSSFGDTEVRGHASDIEEASVLTREERLGEASS